MKSVVIVGVGLIGGSFALALRKIGYQGEILGVSSPSTISSAKGIIDRGISLNEAQQADLIFLAQPIHKIIQTLPQLSGAKGLITDAGSTKREICQAARNLPQFIGGHPMAGKEVRGVENSDPDLFLNRPWLLTAEPPEWFRTILEQIGSRVMVTTPEEHDSMIALASHMPQLVSCAIARVTKPVKSVGGPGLESMTRLSRSSYDIWKDIIETNREQAIAALSQIIQETSRLRDILERNDPEIASYFESKTE